MKWILLIGLGCWLGTGVLRGESTNAAPTLTLADARALALRQHPQLAAANYRALAAEQAVTVARSGFFPTADLFVSGAGAATDNTRILAGGLNNPSVFNREAQGLGISQLLTDFGRTANLTASAKFQAQAEHQNAAATREQVLLGVDSGYYGALEAQAVEQVAQQTFDTRQLLLDQVSALASNKLKSELDVSFAQVALEEGRLLLQRAQNNAGAAMATLSTALGNSQFQPYQLVEPPPSAPPETNDVNQLVQAGLRDRPELLRLRAERDATLRFARAERDARFPTVAAVGTAGDSPVHDDRLADTYAAAGVTLSLPLFAGGRYTARQHEAEAQSKADTALLHTAEDNVIRDVRIAWLNVNNAWERLRTTEQLLQHANEAYTLASARYATQLSSIVELSQAQLTLTSAQIDRANARYDLLIQESLLQYQIGALR